MVASPFRRIITELPVPESIVILDEINRLEPRLRAQMPTVWDRAEGAQVHDGYGNVWLDWTSGILTANAGHSAPQVVDAVIEQAKRGVLHSYRFPSRIKAEYLGALSRLTNFESPVLASTGSEAVEIAMKIALEKGRKNDRDSFISFDGAFHGSTMATTALSGIANAVSFPIDYGRFNHLPYPGTESDPPPTIKVFEEQLYTRFVDVNRIAAVFFEPYLSVSLEIADGSFMRQLARWCSDHDILLIADEVQSGFGRTGTFFAHEQLGIVPDLVCVSKAISGSLPLAAVLCRSADLLRYSSSSLYTTHSGNPLALAAGLATAELYADGSLIEHARQMGFVLQRGLLTLAANHPQHISRARGWGMVGGLFVANEDASKAHVLVEQAWRRGLLLLAPITVASVMIKAAPPLVTTEDQLLDGIGVLEEVLAELGS